MNRGLLGKALRETVPVTLLFGAAVFLVELALAYVLPAFQEQFSDTLLELPFVRNAVGAMLGTQVGESLGTEAFHSIGWVHPAVLALLWAHAIVVCTRVPAGEVDRGSVDFLLGLPVSRWEIHATETIVWLGSGLAVVAAVAAGNALASSALAPALRPPPEPRWIAAANLFGLYLTAGAFAWFVSSLSDRRGRAITLAFVVLLASFLLRYLAQFWEPARGLSPLSLLHYYKPLAILRDAAWPTGDLAVLGLAATALWGSAAALFLRRDLCAV